MKVNKVIDTNVILHDPFCLNKIEGNIILTSTVLAELDSFKKSQNELARNVREFTRQIKDRTDIVFYDDSDDFDFGTKVDNDLRIIRAAKAIDAVVVTNDLLMAFRAKAENLETEEYIPSNKVQGEVYTGIVEGNSAALEGELEPNQYVNNRGGKIERWTGKEFVGLGKDMPVWGLKHKNLEQRCAMDALLDDRIQLVTISGKAGTGKTLLAIAAALESTITNNRYDKISVARPIVPMGNDIGFLPGDMEEKLGPWMQPIMDNIQYLFSKQNGNYSPQAYEELNQQGLIQVEALMYIRGRSMPRQYIIIDEAQNLTEHEVKTIITRAGEGTKIVLTGDPDQIDNPRLDSINNGLTYIIERFKNQEIAAHITLTKGERSKLAEIASEIL